MAVHWYHQVSHQHNCGEVVVIPWNDDGMMAALAPTDEAFRQMEAKWGVGRLERLVSPPTLEALRRGWTLWRKAIEGHDVVSARVVGPKMVEMLRRTDREATAGGHLPLSVDTFEAQMADGSILVVVRTTAEAAALDRKDLGKEPNLPPDLARAVHHQQAGRRLCVWTVGELARMLPTLEMLHDIKHMWPGATIVDGPRPITGENDHHDWVTADPVRAVIEMNPEPPSSRLSKSKATA